MHPPPIPAPASRTSAAPSPPPPTASPDRSHPARVKGRRPTSAGSPRPRPRNHPNRSRLLVRPTRTRLEETTPNRAGQARSRRAVGRGLAGRAPTRAQRALRASCLRRWWAHRAVPPRLEHENGAGSSTRCRRRAGRRRALSIPSRPQGIDLRPPHTAVCDPSVQQQDGAETLAETPWLTHCTSQPLTRSQATVSTPHVTFPNTLAAEKASCRAVSLSAVARPRHFALARRAVGAGRDGHGVTPLELLFDLVFVFGVHAGHDRPVGRSDLERARAGPADPRRALVGVGGLRLVDEHRRSRRGRGAGGDAGGDGGDVRRGARRPRRVRQSRCPVRGCVPDRERHAPHAVCARGARRSRSAGGDPADRARRPSSAALSSSPRGSSTAGSSPCSGWPRSSSACSGRSSRHQRLARAAGALRRAARADRDHRDRRVPDRDRLRGDETPGSTPA